ncbi:hypothetical protein ACLQ20_18000 [Micromonospora sp. DT46]
MGLVVFDGEGSTGVADADVDFLAGDDEDAVAADASFRRVVVRPSRATS